MSHFIVATGAEGMELATLDIGSRPMGVLASSHMDVYALYEAADCNAGVSGNGQERSVGLDTVRRAYLWCRAWYAALETVEAEDSDEDLPPECQAFARTLDGDEREVFTELKAEIQRRFEEESFAEYDGEVEYCRTRAPDLAAFSETVYTAALASGVSIRFA